MCEVRQLNKIFKYLFWLLVIILFLVLWGWAGASEIRNCAEFGICP